jgi:hypothetical protein
LKTIDTDLGRDPKHDRHHFGLVGSVAIGVQRLLAVCDAVDAREGRLDTKQRAVGLLMALALLHGSNVPLSLFKQPPMALKEKAMDDTAPLEQQVTDASVSRALCLCNVLVCVGCSSYLWSLIVVPVDM